MAEEIKTMAIPAMLKQAEDTGLITDESLAALEAENLQAQEKIKNLRRLHRENSISREQMEAGIRTIQQKIEAKTTALDVDNDILP
ncbi:hypothetical protein ACFLZH_04450 [Patescibacteria group bacterium]